MCYMFLERQDIDVIAAVGKTVGAAAQRTS
jgi:hypothetical protein